MLGGFPVSWKTRKQTIAELLWLQNLLHSPSIDHSHVMELVYDNKVTIHIAATPVFHERTKHVEIDCHFVHDHLKERRISTRHASSALQLANIFTKALGQDCFHFLLHKLGIFGVHAPT